MRHVHETEKPRPRSRCRGLICGGGLLLLQVPVKTSKFDKYHRRNNRTSNVNQKKKPTNAHNADVFVLRVRGGRPLPSRETADRTSFGRAFLVRCSRRIWTGHIRFARTILEAKMEVHPSMWNRNDALRLVGAVLAPLLLVELAYAPGIVLWQMHMAGWRIGWTETIHFIWHYLFLHAGWLVGIGLFFLGMARLVKCREYRWSVYGWAWPLLLLLCLCGLGFMLF